MICVTGNQQNLRCLNLLEYTNLLILHWFRRRPRCLPVEIWMRGLRCLPQKIQTAYCRLSDKNASTGKLMSREALLSSKNRLSGNVRAYEMDENAKDGMAVCGGVCTKYGNYICGVISLKRGRINPCGGRMYGV